MQEWQQRPGSDTRGLLEWIQKELTVLERSTESSEAGTAEPQERVLAARERLDSATVRQLELELAQTKLQLVGRKFCSASTVLHQPHYALCTSSAALRIFLVNWSSV